MGKGYMGSESKCPNIYRHIGIEDGYLYFEIEDYDEDGDLDDISYRILLSGPDLTPEKSPI